MSGEWYGIGVWTPSPSALAAGGLETVNTQFVVSGITLVHHPPNGGGASWMARGVGLPMRCLRRLLGVPFASCQRWAGASALPGRVWKRLLSQRAQQVLLQRTSLPVPSKRHGRKRGAVYVAFIKYIK